MGVKVHSHWRHLAAKVAIFGLVIQAVMAAAMLPMPIVLSSAEASPFDSGGVLICTGTGFKRVTIDENGNPVEKPVPGMDCPVCTALSSVTFAVHAAPPAVPVSLSKPVVLLPVNEHIPASPACLAHNNRGPPTLI